MLPSAGEEDDDMVVGVQSLLVDLDQGPKDRRSKTTYAGIQSHYGSTKMAETSTLSNAWLSSSSQCFQEDRKVY